MKKQYMIIVVTVFTLVSCSTRTPVTELENKEAAVPPTYHLSTSGLQVITSFINRKQGTTSVLYGNTPAKRDATNSLAGTLAGERFVLVTWRQQEDPHWFGARIPGRLQTVETLETVLTGKEVQHNYQRFGGKALEAARDTLGNAARINLILVQKPAVMP